jgi:hypothetical protein
MNVRLFSLEAAGATSQQHIDVCHQAAPVEEFTADFVSVGYRMKYRLKLSKPGLCLAPVLLSEI